MAFWIPSHVQLCVVKEGIVFLDLRAGRYFGIGPAEAAALAQWVHDWPHDFCRQEQPAPGERAGLETANELSRMSLLSRVPQSGRVVSVLSDDLTSSLIAVDSSSPADGPITVGHAVRFVWACASAAVALRFRSMESIVHSVSARKRLPANSNSQFDEALACRLSTIFRRLRPYFFSAENRCLFHALALINFMACYRVHPLWIVGIQLTPWRAHSWVQQGDLVFDSTPEAVFDYKPILSV